MIFIKEKHNGHRNKVNDKIFKNMQTFLKIFILSFDQSFY
jgi:hypothetical protein